MDPNFEPYKYIYVIMVESSFVMPEFGFASGAGTWMRARQFQCHKDAAEALADPTWHAAADDIKRAGKVVRLEVSVTPKFFDRV